MIYDKIGQYLAVFSLGVVTSKLYSFFNPSEPYIIKPTSEELFQTRLINCTDYQTSNLIPAKVNSATLAANPNLIEEAAQKFHVVLKENVKRFLKDMECENIEIDYFTLSFIYSFRSDDFLSEYKNIHSHEDQEKLDYYNEIFISKRSEYFNDFFSMEYEKEKQVGKYLFSEDRKEFYEFYMGELKLENFSNHFFKSLILKDENLFCLFAKELDKFKLTIESVDTKQLFKFAKTGVISLDDLSSDQILNLLEKYDVETLQNSFKHDSSIFKSIENKINGNIFKLSIEKLELFVEYGFDFDKLDAQSIKIAGDSVSEDKLDLFYKNFNNIENKKLISLAADSEKYLDKFNVEDFSDKAVRELFDTQSMFNKKIEKKLSYKKLEVLFKTFNFEKSSTLIVKEILELNNLDDFLIVKYVPAEKALLFALYNKKEALVKKIISDSNLVSITDSVTLNYIQKEHPELYSKLSHTEHDKIYFGSELAKTDEKTQSINNVGVYLNAKGEKFYLKYGASAKEVFSSLVVKSIIGDEYTITPDFIVDLSSNYASYCTKEIQGFEKANSKKLYYVSYKDDYSNYFKDFSYMLYQSLDINKFTAIKETIKDYENFVVANTVICHSDLHAANTGFVKLDENNIKMTSVDFDYSFPHYISSFSSNEQLKSMRNPICTKGSSTTEKYDFVVFDFFNYIKVIEGFADLDINNLYKKTIELRNKFFNYQNPDFKEPFVDTLKETQEYFRSQFNELNIVKQYLEGSYDIFDAIDSLGGKTYIDHEILGGQISIFDLHDHKEI